MTLSPGSRRAMKGAVYLMADSTPMFAAEDVLWPSLQRDLHGPRSAAYIGASNGDDPAFYSIFEAAMDRAGIAEHRMISARFGSEDSVFLDRAGLVVLAGGDVRRGWEVIVQTGMRESLVRRHREGMVLMGISAGAMQLGLALPDGGEGWCAGLGLVPRVVEAHAAEQGWPLLHAALHERDTRTGLGLGWGSTVICRTDGAVALLHGDAVESRWGGGQLRLRPMRGG